MTAPINPYEAPQERSAATRPEPVVRPRRPLHPLLLAAIACQCVVIAVLTFVPFGFDHASSWGLDFDDFLKVAACLTVTWLIGIVTAFATRRFALGSVQMGLPLLGFLLAGIGPLVGPILIVLLAGLTFAEWLRDRDVRAKEKPTDVLEP
ncbi:MAG: hypothetical protein QM811_25795 [Pirellulales bacterium]